MSNKYNHVWESTCHYWLNDMYKPVQTTLYQSRTRAIRDAIITIRDTDLDEHQVKEVGTGTKSKKDFTVVSTSNRPSKQYIIRKKAVV